MVLTELILTISTWGGCDGHDRIDLEVSTLRVCPGLERTDFKGLYFGNS